MRGASTATNRAKRLRGQAADWVSALAVPSCDLAFAVGLELLVGQHADQDDGAHHSEIERIEPFGPNSIGARKNYSDSISWLIVFLYAWPSPAYNQLLMQPSKQEREALKVESF